MQRLEVSGAVRPLYVSLGVKGLRKSKVLYVRSYPVSEQTDLIFPKE